MRRPGSSIRRQVELRLGKAGTLLGHLAYARQGQREHCAFAYSQSWLSDPEGFNVSADLRLEPGYQPHKAVSQGASLFHGAIADTEPDAWGRRVIARDHAKRRRQNPQLGPLTEMDYLLAVDDFSRVGALRLSDNESAYLRTVAEGSRNTPPMVELGKIFSASRALERGEETIADLQYLQGKGTSLGGMRPKCTIVEEDGWLAIGKFPSIGDLRSVTRGEVLALQLARKAGINAADARTVQIDDIAIAVIRRFDRDLAHRRIPNQSAASMLQASRQDERSYVELADAIRRYGATPIADLHELWRRLVFNLLTTNVDDHLQNHGFLHSGRGLWRLAPAFDINPFPDKDRESKLWLTEHDGPITDVRMLLGRASAFALDATRAIQILAEVCEAVSNWRSIAVTPIVGLRLAELEEFAPAFEHEQMREAIHTLRDL